ncbi:MAG: DUF4364 family protein [Clostridiales bacterium]|nr:DUF4364 family protein [Clostridiales bacterium]
MERKHIPETENRLIILYALRALGPVTAMQLLQCMAESDLMNYITMQLSLGEMERQGQITQRAHPLGNLLELTDEGEYILRSFERRIPASRRRLIDERAAAWRERFATEQMAPAEAFALPDGRTAVHLRLLDKAATLLDLMLYLPAGKSFTLLPERWHSCVQATYSTVLAYLTADYDASLPMPEAKDTEAVRQCGMNDWLLTLTDDPQAPTIDLMMSLPDEHLARCSALEWPHAAQRIRQFVLEALENARPGR